MRYLDLTLPTLAENLALDEALLEEAETAARPVETLRLWEARQYAVVIGRSSRMAVEVRGDVCRELERARLAADQRRGGGRRGAGLPDVRRGAQPAASAAVALHRSGPRPGAGHDRRGPAAVGPGLALRGICDLAIGEKKVSGNSVRVQTRASALSWHALVRFPAGDDRPLPGHAAPRAGLSPGPAA